MSRLAGTPRSSSNAIWVPSGDQAGRSSLKGGDEVIFFGFVALRGCVRACTKMSYLFDAETPRAKAILARSGDQVGRRGRPVAGGAMGALGRPARVGVPLGRGGRDRRGERPRRGGHEGDLEEEEGGVRLSGLVAREDDAAVLAGERRRGRGRREREQRNRPECDCDAGR